MIVITAGTGGQNDRSARICVMDTLDSLRDVSLVIYDPDTSVGAAVDIWADHTETPSLRWVTKLAHHDYNAAVLAFALKVANPTELLLVALPGSFTADMTERCRNAGVAIMKVN